MPLQNEGVIYLNKEDNEMCNCIASYNTSKTQLHKRWVVGMLLGAPCCWWGGCNETGGGGEWSEGGGCWHTLALGHVGGCTAPQTPDTISSEDNDRDELQRRTA